MASTLRLPVVTPRNLSQPSLAGSYQCRAFSQTSQQWAGGRAVNFRPPSVAQPSFKTRTKDLKLADLPNDIGLLPGTFIRPLWRDMPSIFQAPRDRLHMEWTWFKSWFSNYGRSVVLRMAGFVCRYHDEKYQYIQLRRECLLTIRQSAPILQA